jgi:hypothetical protein
MILTKPTQAFQHPISRTPSTLVVLIFFTSELLHV